MFNEPVVYVDIETTGGSYRFSRIIEIAAIRVENGQVVGRFNSLINPGIPIPHHITRLTGITNRDVSDTPYFADIAEELHKILSGAIFIAHHVRFDYSFIKRQLDMCNIAFSPRMLCSVRLSRALYPQESSHKLESIINRFNIATTHRHRALEDAEVVMKFMDIAFRQHGLDVFAEAVKKQLKHRSAPPNVPSHAFDSIPDTIGVYTFSDQSGTPIYIGKSVTLKKRIMSHFAQDTAIDKEMKLSLNTHNISYTETGTELEALLLESHMIKERLPLYNRKLRRLRKMYVLKATQNEQGYFNIELDYVDSGAVTPDSELYGVYASRIKAKRSLDELQHTFSLCPKLLGLEKASSVCFRYQLGKCLGACGGLEDASTYNNRFETAFSKQKIEKWPYAKPIILHDLGRSDTAKNLVIDNWNVIGEIHAEEGCETHFKPWQTVFDIDTYKIIRSYLAKKAPSLQIKPISYSQLDLIVR